MEDRWLRGDVKKRLFAVPDSAAIAILLNVLPKQGQKRQLLAAALLNRLADDLPLITALLRHVCASDAAATTWLAANGGRSNRCRLVLLENGCQEIVNEMFRLLK